MNKTTFNVTLDTDLKEQAEEALKPIDMTLNHVFYLMCHVIVTNSKTGHCPLPYELHIPGKETREAMTESEAGIGLTRYGSTQEMLDDLENDDE